MISFQRMCELPEKQLFFYKNPLLIHEFPLHGLKVGAWCAMNKLGLLGLLLVHELTKSQ
jgi:hypothetical protein